MQAARQWVLIFVLAVTLIGYSPVSPALASAENPAEEAIQSGLAAQNSALSLTEPSACPPGGCAAGQRLGMRFEFSLSGSGYDASLNPNIKVCIYAPSKWSAAATDLSKGEITGVTYSAPDPADPTLNCTQDTSQPADYSLMIERQAQLKQNTTGDSLRFGFRLGRAATGSGTVIARLFAQTAQDKWSLIASASSSIIDMASTPFSTTEYVANNGASCGSYSPCYINSYGDLPNGIGTGLKDAIDVVDEKATNSTTIYILGDYSVKSEMVQVNKKLTITGVNDSRITYNGSPNACGAAMLALDETVKFSGLNLDDGNCTSDHRNLIEINSQSGRTGADDTVSILSSDLTNGDNAVYVKSTTTDSVIIRYNEITGNTGYAVYYESTANATSSLDVTANNLQSNRSGPAIQCAQNGIATNQKANHNYWGAGSPTTTDSYCIIDPAKRLGAPILHNANLPGLAAVRKTVKTGGPYSAFDNQIAYTRTGDSKPENDFDIYLVNHGYMNTSAPFTYDLGGEGISPCSNYWDVFLADGAQVSNTLELYFRYNDHSGGAPGCITTINSSLYCDQTSSIGKYPLYWFDPSSSPATKWWDPVGAKPEKLSSGEGQTTTCHMDQNEIQVSIDGSGRPNLTDLGYSPFVVGIPVIKEFLPKASSQTVNVTWTTNVEPDISGFYVLWGNTRDNLSLLNDTMITHTGTSTSGKSYSLYHYNRVNGSTYYYRLKVVRSDGTVFYSEIYEIKVDVATPVPPTPTYTWTPVVPTRTRTATTVYQSYPTQSGYKTPTPQKTATASKTGMVLPTLTKTLDARTPGVADTLAALSLTPEPQNPAYPGANTPGGDQIGAQGTEVAQVGLESATPSPSPTSLHQAVAGENTVNTHPWLSLLLGLLAGMVVVGGAGGWWYRSNSSK